MKVIRSGTTLGKYKVKKKLGEGGFATVYEAFDTIEGVSVALKVPHQRHMSSDTLEDFRKEVRTVARLDHPNVLHLKNASFIDDVFVIVYPLGIGTLRDRMKKRMSFDTLLHLADQALEAVAYAHMNRVIHCDIKPDNFILFEDDHLRLSDFGIAKVAMATRTIIGSGAGTVGYLAPDQALGQPSFRSDVFSLGLVLFEMFTGELPEWPFEWPVPGVERLRGRMHKDLIAFFRKALQVSSRKRFVDAEQMQAAFIRLRPKLVRYATTKRNRSRKKKRGVAQSTKAWREVKLREFRRLFGKTLETRYECPKCEGPVSEAMLFCPWCAKKQTKLAGETKLPDVCRRCERGMKKDWTYCAYCYGPGYEIEDTREYSDRRYSAKCSNKSCPRKDLWPFMQYCPWCRTKVRKKWKIPNADRHVGCKRCGWGILPMFWSNCPWCGRKT